MDTVLSDIRFALRSLMRRPVFALTAIGTLALGIGANASIFTVTNGLLLTPLPYESPDELVLLFESNPELGWDEVDVSAANAWDWRARSRTLEDLAIHNGDAFNLTSDGPPEQVVGQRVTPNMLSLLGYVMPQGTAFIKQVIKLLLGAFGNLINLGFQVFCR